jgi:hypothetical protein
VEGTSAARTNDVAVWTCNWRVTFLQLVAYLHNSDNVQSGIARGVGTGYIFDSPDCLVGNLVPREI